GRTVLIDALAGNNGDGRQDVGHRLDVDEERLGERVIGRAVIRHGHADGGRPGGIVARSQPDASGVGRTRIGDVGGRQEGRAGGGRRACAGSVCWCRWVCPPPYWWRNWIWGPGWPPSPWSSATVPPQPRM